MNRRKQLVGAQAIYAGIGARFCAASQACFGAFTEQRILVAREEQIAVIDRIHAGTQDFADLDSLWTGALTHATALTALRSRVQMLIALEKRNIRRGNRART